MRISAKRWIQSLLGNRKRALSNDRGRIGWTIAGYDGGNEARPLGFEGFAAAAAGTRVPVFALGGLRPGDLATALAHGAHGIAMRRYAWPSGSPDCGFSGVSIR